MTPTLSADELALAELIETDPVFFAREILGHDHWAVPQAILRALSRPRARVAVKSCHSSGKTFTAADSVLWWVITGGIAITTAPTWTQVRRLLWGEIRKSHMGARMALGGELTQTELKIAPDVYGMGLSTNEGVRFQGFHGKVLIVLDEAVGVRPDIYESIEGIRAGGDVRILALGNPTVPSGPFYDAFAAHRNGWQTFTIDAFDTPNLSGLSLEDLLALPEHELDHNPRPYLVTRRWVREKYDEWGERSPLWASRVRGQFPLQSEDSLISLAWLENAREDQEGVGDLTAGIDVAGPGEDETVLCVRQGPQIIHLEAWADSDPRGDVLAALRPYRDRLTDVNVDSVGQGYYFACHLADHGYANQVQGINVGEATSDREKYVNLKAEAYWGLRMRFQTGEVGGLTDDLAISQLASIRYAHNARGQVVIETKEQARKRGVKSPDRAEAIMLAFWTPPTLPAYGSVMVLNDDDHVTIGPRL